MSKFKVIALILLTAVFISARAYCQQITKDQVTSTVTGKVTYVDPETGVLNVQTELGNVVFYIAVESELFRVTKPMSSIEIAKDDPVIIKYISSSGKNKIISLVDNKPSSY